MTTVPPEGRGAIHRRTNTKNTDDAEKLELLLETFRRVDGDKWMLREIENATGRAVSASYLSSIRARRISRVGNRQREAMARVMGFPVELWDAEPERWPSILADKRDEAEGGRGSASPLADLLEDLFRRGRHPLTGGAFTERSVAELSGGALAEDEVSDIRRGRLTDPPEAKLLALSDVFGVPRSYWYGPASVPPLDENTARFLSGPRRLRALHMQLIDLPEDKRDEIGAVLESLVERAREQLTGKEGDDGREEGRGTTTR